MWDTKKTSELILLAQAGDAYAREELLSENVPLVKSLIKKFLGRGFDYDDLFQTGMIGLIKAIDGFNVEKGVRLSTYAVPLILGEVKKFVRDYNSVKIPRSIKELQQKIKAHQAKRLAQNEKEPTVEELSRELSCSREDVLVAIESMSACASLDEKNEDGLSILDVLEQKSDRASIFDRLALEQCLLTLDDRAKKVILMRFFREKTQTEVAKMLGISQVQVSRIESKAIETLRKKLK